LRFSDVMPNTVAVLGTGRMGDAIAHKLLAAGFAVHAWNRTRERAAAVVAAGAVAAHTPFDAVAEADVVVTMLTDGGVVAAVMNDADGGGLAAMTPGCTWIQMGTIGPSWTDELAALAAARGVPFVDAPVMGSDDAARAGTLVVLASGPESARGAVAPVFDAVARRTLWLGPAGAGSRLKLAVNNWLACLVEGVAETLALTAALGLDPRLFLEATVGGPLAAPFALTKARAMLDGQVSPGFALRDALKDVAMALDVAGAKGVELPLTEALTQRWAPAAANGLGDRDVSSVVRLAGDLIPHASSLERTQMLDPRPDATDLPRGSFADGQSDADRFPYDARLGRFSDGEAEPLLDAEARRFSEGQEELGETDPEKHIEGGFSDESPGPPTP
jgi:3-hydroxyisobutyrate dehydrogenase